MHARAPMSDSACNHIASPTTMPMKDDTASMRTALGENAANGTTPPAALCPATTQAKSAVAKLHLKRLSAIALPLQLSQ